VQTRFKKEVLGKKGYSPTKDLFLHDNSLIGD
jgi:hypothetical protein